MNFIDWSFLATVINKQWHIYGQICYVVPGSELFLKCERFGTNVLEWFYNTTTLLKKHFHYYFYHSLTIHERKVSWNNIHNFTSHKKIISNKKNRLMIWLRYIITWMKSIDVFVHLFRKRFKCVIMKCVRSENCLDLKIVARFRMVSVRKYSHRTVTTTWWFQWFHMYWWQATGQAINLIFPQFRLFSSFETLRSYTTEFYLVRRIRWIGYFTFYELCSLLMSPFHSVYCQLWTCLLQSNFFNRLVNITKCWEFTQQNQIKVTHLIRERLLFYSWC